VRSETSLLTVVAGCVVSFILQVALAPNLMIAGVAAEFTLCFAVANAMRSSQTAATLCGFLLGALVDLATGNPLGIRAFAYCLVAFAISPLSSLAMLNNNLARYMVMVVMLFCGELIIAVLTALVLVGSDIMFETLSTVLPSGLFDAVAGLVFLPYITMSYGRSSGNTGKSLKETLPPV